jgi:asparagine synthase (glutamine-hydrolysing)
MCGICGIYDMNHPEVAAETVVRMRDVMITRGPDDAGLHLSPHIGLGHRRLSIMDISAAGHQPMTNEDGTIWITFNGEIYNFRELREILAAKGHLFHSFTDTEVLIHGYEEWGIEELLRKINGMFAFALWNSVKEELILARDRLGVKPLFYTEKNGKVYFSSDIKSIILAYDRGLTMDCHAIDDFLYSYCIPQEYSIFREIKKILPSHYIVFKKNGTSTNQYWRLSFASKLEMSEEDYLDELSGRFLSAVRSRMISDVPIGAFLSGGVDSSLVVAVMATLSGSPIKTFSMGVKEASYNELKYARMVAEKYSTEHHEFIVEPDALSILPEIIWAYGEPFADASQIPTYYVSRLTREHVTVALTGDGGDESFCGYNRNLIYHYASRYRKYVPAVLRNSLIPPVANALLSLAGRHGVVSKIKTLTEFGRGSFKDSLRTGGIFGLDYREKVYTPDFKRKLSNHSPIDVLEKYFKAADGLSEVDKSLYIGIKTALPNDYLTKVDVATMMNSLEARSPFLDYELIEFAAKIPSEAKAKYGGQKYLLKKLAARYVPRAAVYRKKSGFSIPIGFWFRKKGMKQLLNDILLSDRAAKRGYFDMNFLRNIVRDHLTGKADHTYRLWSLLCLELWHLMFIDKVISRSDNLS